MSIFHASSHTFPDSLRELHIKLIIIVSSQDYASDIYLPHYITEGRPQRLHGKLESVLLAKSHDLWSDFAEVMTRHSREEAEEYKITSVQCSQHHILKNRLTDARFGSSGVQ